MTDDSKGRATPSRKEAEAARRAQMKQPITRKERTKRQRQRNDEQRARQREAMRAGHGPDLPARERGPVRAFDRDYVDRRWTFNELLLPILLVVLVISFAATPTTALLTVVVYVVSFTFAVIDSIRLARGLKKGLRERFSDSQLGGDVAYVLIRSTQPRFVRLPKPTIRRGEPLREHYR